MKYTMVVGGRSFEVQVTDVGAGAARVHVNGQPYDVRLESCQERSGPRPPVGAPVVPTPPAAVGSPIPSKTAAPAPDVGRGALREPVVGGTAVLAPMPGTVLTVEVCIGAAVAEGEPVLTMEAMKMENEIAATATGTVKEIRVSPGEQVATGDVLVVIG